MAQTITQTSIARPRFRWKLTAKFLVQFAIGLLLALGIASLIQFSSQGNLFKIQEVTLPLSIGPINLVPAYLNLTLAGGLGGLLYSMLVDQTLEFPSFGKNDKGLRPGFLGDIFVGIAGALIAFTILPAPLKEPLNGDYTEVSIMIFVTALVGGYGGKSVLDLALQRLINRIKDVDLTKEKLEQVSKVEKLQKLANRQIYQGLNPEELTNLQTELQSTSINPKIKKRIVERARDARRLGSRVKAYQDRTNRVVPVLKAVAEGETDNDYYQAQLACAYRDCIPPRLDEALLKFDEAITLHPNNWHYELDRVVARIRKAFQEGEANKKNSPSSDNILQDLFAIDSNRSLAQIFLEFDQGRTKPIKDWLGKNQDWVKQVRGGSSLLKEAFEAATIIPRDDLNIAPPNTTIKAITRTFLKKQPIQASELNSNQKVEVPPSRSYKVHKYSTLTNGHYQIELDHNAGIWYIWLKHWDLPWEDKDIAPIPKEHKEQVNIITVRPLLLRGSVGSGGKNNADDVVKIKQRLKELDFDWLNPGSQADKGLIQAIKLFQSIIYGRTTVHGDGRIDLDGQTHQWLQASNAPHWIEMPIEGKGFVNYERKDNTDDHDYGTDWLSDVITAAGKHYEDNHRKGRANISPIPINDISRPHGGFTKDHGGHQCGNACDIYLPRKGGGYSLPTWNDSRYDRDAAKAILLALHAQPLVRKDRIFFNDTTLIGEGLCKSLRGHHHHIHFEVGVPQKIKNVGNIADDKFDPVDESNVVTNGTLSRWEKALKNCPTQGCKRATAKPEGLSTPGVAASHEIARRDMEKNLSNARLNSIKKAAQKLNVPVAIIIALASRESHLGSILGKFGNKPGWGDNNHGWGILQVDRRHHTLVGLDDPYSQAHVEQAIGIFSNYRDQIKKNHPTWKDEYVLKGACVAYNSGPNNVKTIAGMNQGTTHHDYGDDVIARAQFYLEKVK